MKSYRSRHVTMALLMLACLIPCFLSAQTRAPAILKTDEPVKIDGDLSEKIWKRARRYPIAWIIGGAQNGKLSNSVPGYIQYCWDAHYLYIAYQVKDVNLVNVPSQDRRGPKDNPRTSLVKVQGNLPVDFISLFIALGDDHFSWQLDHNASNHLNDFFVLLPPREWYLAQSTLAEKNGLILARSLFIRDEQVIDWDTGEKQVFRLQTATRLTGKSSIALNLTDASANDHDEGYTAELRLPWFGLGVQRSTRTAKGYNLANEKIRILAMLRDGSQPNSYFASGRIEEGAYVQLQIGHWPLFTLAP